MEGQKIWKATCKQYNHYLKELPDYGGKKNPHALSIFGSILVFSLYPLLPDQPSVEELQELVTHLFMAPFEKLGKIFNLNRNFDMWLIDKVFHIVGKKDRKQYLQYPATFINISEPYDEENHAARYHFLQCPNAKFAKNIISCIYFHYFVMLIIGESVNFMVHLFDKELVGTVISVIIVLLVVIIL